MKRAITILFAASLSVTATAAPVPSARVSLFARTLVFKLPAGFVLANEKRNDTHVLIELVPQGEGLANWKRMITIQAYRGLGASSLSSAQIARQAFYPAACKKEPLYRDQGEKAFGPKLKRSIIVNGCASLPPGAYPKALAGAGEQDFIMMFRDADTIYTLNYAVRGKSFAGKALPVALDSAEGFLQEIFGRVSL